MCSVFDHSLKTSIALKLQLCNNVAGFIINVADFIINLNQNSLDLHGNVLKCVVFFNEHSCALDQISQTHPPVTCLWGGVAQLTPNCIF